MTITSIHGVRLFSADAVNIKELVELAVAQEIDLDRANLTGAYLFGAKLTNAKLRGASLSGAELQEADLTGANLSEVDLKRANLYKAILNKANLYSADLRQADLERADLREANITTATCRSTNMRLCMMRFADLSRSCFETANLTGADLTGAKLNLADFANALLYKTTFSWDDPNAKLIWLRTRIIPEEGEIIGWKKLRMGTIAKLRIPAEAKRSHAYGRKCRAEYAEVLELWSGDTPVESGNSLFMPAVEYRVGKIMRPHGPFDLDWAEECATGIHFYISREEAEAHE